jgi:hypothetical protein
MDKTQVLIVALGKIFEEMELNVKKEKKALLEIIAKEKGISYDQLCKEHNIHNFPDRSWDSTKYKEKILKEMSRV